MTCRQHRPQGEEGGHREGEDTQFEVRSQSKDEDRHPGRGRKHFKEEEGKVIHLFSLSFSSPLAQSTFWSQILLASQKVAPVSPKEQQNCCCLRQSGDRCPSRQVKRSDEEKSGASEVLLEFTVPNCGVGIKQLLAQVSAINREKV